MWRRRTPDDKAERAAEKAARKAAYQAYDRERRSLRDGTHPDAFVTVHMPRTAGAPNWRAAVREAKQHGMYETDLRVLSAGRIKNPDEVSIRAHFEPPSTLRCEPGGPVEAGDQIRFQHGDHELAGVVTSVASVPGGRVLHSFSYLDGCQDQCTGTFRSRPHVLVAWTRPKIAAPVDRAGGPRVLVLSANAGSDLDLEEEVRSIRKAVKGSGGTSDDIIYAPATRPADLVDLVRSESPRVVHFAGHGDSGGIELRDDGGKPVVASSGALCSFLEHRGVDLVVLNSCYSEQVARSLTSSVVAVVGTTAELSDQDANEFSAVFYQQLARGASVGEAYRDAKDSVALAGGDDVFQLIGDRDLRIVAAH